MDRQPIGRATRVLCGILGVLAAEVTTAQVPFRSPRDLVNASRNGLLGPGNGQNESRWSNSLDPDQSPLGQRYGRFSQGGQEGLRGLVPRYDTFPNYQQALPRFGAYPFSAHRGLQRQDSLQLPFGLVTPIASDREDSWPSWMQLDGDEVVPRPQAAALAGMAERVWWLPAGETAFVPLSHYDRFRLMRPKGAVEVRNQGEFQVAFHDGGRVRSMGPARLRVDQLSTEAAVCRLSHFSKVWWRARTRSTAVTLPDGSTLTLANAGVVLTRTGDRASLANDGPDPVQIRRGALTTTVPAGRQIDLFLAPPRAAAVGSALQIDGPLRVTRDGRALEVRGDGAGGSVGWSGLRIRVPDGALLRIDPLAGDGFPEYPPKK